MRSLSLPPSLVLSLSFSLCTYHKIKLRTRIENAKLKTEENYCAIVSDHLVYAAQKHFPEENYFKVGENPVIFLYTVLRVCVA